MLALVMVRVFSSHLQPPSSLFSIQSHQYKLIMNTEDQSLSLFDIRQDPLEKNDISLSAVKLADKLSRRLNRHREKMESSFRLPRKQISFPPEKIEELFDGGYLP